MVQEHGSDNEGQVSVMTWNRAKNLMESGVQRELLPMSEVGLGPYNPNTAVPGTPDDCKVRRFSWTHMQRAYPYRDAVLENVSVEHGSRNVRRLKHAPGNDARIKEMIMDETTITQMAEYWAAPNSETDFVRQLPSDQIRDPRPPRVDIKSKLLYFMRHSFLTQEGRNPLAESAVDEIDAGHLPQYHCDRHSSKILANKKGNGGLEGSTIVLWKITKNNHNFGMLDDTFNRLVSFLSQCLGSPEMPAHATLMPAVSTQFSEALSSKKDVFNMMRVVFEGDPSTRDEIYAYPQSRDMHPEWLQKLAQYRQQDGRLPPDADLDHVNLIPESSRVNNPDLEPHEREMSEEECTLHQDIIKGSLFKLQLFIGLYPALDADGREQHLQLSCLRIRGLPFADPIVALQQLCTYGVGGAALTEPLLAISRHMASVLRLPQQTISLDALWNTNGSVNAASLFGEENILPAIFKQADAFNLTDVDVGGRRMDVRNAAEMKLYKRYANSVQTARRHQWRFVQNAVVHAMSAMGNRKRAQKGEEVETIANFDGFNFVSIPRKDFHEIIENHIREEHGLSADTSHQDETGQTFSWFLEDNNKILKNQGIHDYCRRKESGCTYGTHEPVPQIYGNGEFYFKMVGPTSFYNHGVLVDIDLMAVEQFWKVKQGQQTHTNIESGLLLPLRVTSALMDLYFDKELTCQCVLDDHRHVFDFKYMERNMARLPPDLLKVLHTLQQWQLKMQDPNRSKSKRQIKENGILALCGRLPHPLHDQRHQIRVNAELLAQASLLQHTSRQAVRKALHTLAHGHMLQLQRAAQAQLHLNDLCMDSQSHGFIDFWGNFNVFVKDWKRDWRSRENQNKVEYMSQEAISITFWNKFMHEQNLEIHYVNGLAIDSIHNSLIAQFIGVHWQPTGTVMHMYDMAGCVEVRINGKQANTQQYMSKSSGCGADLSAAVASMLNNVFYAHMLTNPELRSFYNSAASQDKSFKYITVLRLHCLLGSAVMSSPGGGFDPQDTGYNDYGTNGAALEALKSGTASKDSSQLAIFTEIECRGGNPTSSQHGLASAPYETTQQMIQKKPIILNDCVALFFITTNMAHTNIPFSTLHGSRAFFVFSSSPDTSGKILFDDSMRELPAALADLNLLTSGVNKRKADEAIEEEELDIDPDIECLFESGHADHFLYKNTKRSALKDIDANMTRNGAIGYLIIGVLRRIFPFVHKHMRLHYVERMYSWTTRGNFLHAIQCITQGMWRYHLDPSSFFRNANASYTTVTMIATHMKTIVWDTYLQKCMLPHMDKHGHPVIDMQTAFEDALLACLYRPPSVTTLMSAAALWLSTQMLDLQIAILSQYLLFTMGIQSSCPLHVFALVARHGMGALSQRQRSQYIYIADRVIQLCGTHQQSENLDSSLMTTSMLKPFVKDGSCKLAFEHMFGPEKSQHWGFFEDMKKEHEKHRGHGMGPQRTNFCRANLKGMMLQNMPSWLPYVTTALNSSRRQTHFLPYEDSESILAEVFAQSNSFEECTARLQSNLNSPPHANTNLFWKAAYEGCKLPCPAPSRTDRRDVDFGRPSESGSWFLSIMNSTCKFSCGVTQAFLHMCGLNSSMSLLDIMDRLFGEHLQEKYIAVNRRPVKDVSAKRKAWWPRSESWTQPVSMNTQKFTFGHIVHTWEDGVTHEKKAGVEAVLGADVLWLYVLAPALFCAEWQIPKRGPSEAVVHTRVLSQAVTEIMSLYVHTSLDKASIPCNSGTMHLRMQNPFMRHKQHESMAIPFEPRVHSEIALTHNTLLSARNRVIANMNILHDKRNSAGMFLVYHQQQEENNSRADSASGLALVPPEGVAHMLSYFYEYVSAVRRLRTEHPAIFEPNEHGVVVQCHIPTAVRILAMSMCSAGKPRDIENMAFMQVTPTWCLTHHPDIEMPFVSSKHLFTCVVRTLANGTFVIESTNVNFINGHMLHSDENYKPLPIAAAATGAQNSLVFQQEHFSFAQLCGLRMTADGEVHARQPQSLYTDKQASPDDAKEEVLGLLPFPVWYWPNLVRIGIKGSCLYFEHMELSSADAMELDQDNHAQEQVMPRAQAQLELVLCQDLFESDRKQHWQLDSQEFLRINTDITLSADYTLHVFKSKQDSAFGRQWRFVGPAHSVISNRDMFVHPELMHILRQDTSNEKVFKLSQQQWQHLSQLHDCRLLRDLNHQHYISTVDGSWVPVNVEDTRLCFWITYETSSCSEYQRVNDHMVTRFLWFPNRASLKNFCKTPMQPATWSHAEYLLESQSGARMQMFEVERKMHCVDYKVTEHELYKLREQAVELSDQIAVRVNHIEQLQRQGKFEHIQKYQEQIQAFQKQLQYVQEQTMNNNPQRSVLAAYEYESTVLHAVPSVCASGGPLSRMEVYGMLVPHEETGQYLRHGQYKIEYCISMDDKMSVQSSLLDFVSASQGMVQEGSLLFLNLSRDLYISILQQSNGAYMQNATIHHAVINDDERVALACFYVLHPGQAKNLLDTHITVVIPVHELQYEDDIEFIYRDDVASCKLLVHIPLFDEHEHVRISTMSAQTHVAEDGSELQFVQWDDEQLPVVWHLCRKTFEDDSFCEHEDITDLKPHTNSKHNRVGKA